MAVERAEVEATSGPTKGFSLRQVWLRSCSFDAPLVPRMHFLPDGTIGDDLRLGTTSEALKLLDDRYEVALYLDVQSTRGDETLFRAVTWVVGVFQVVGYEDEEAREVLRTKGAELMYPYAREIVSSMVSRAGVQRLALPTLASEIFAGKKA
jgi:preprotein translocase subunit SecB